MSEIPQILQDANAWAKELITAKWKRIEKNESGRKIDPVYGPAWEDPKTKKTYDLKNAYRLMKNPVDETEPDIEEDNEEGDSESEK